MIMEGDVGGGSTSSGQWAHARRAWYEKLFTTGRVTTSTRKHFEGTAITFSEKDDESILHPYDDMLVVTVQIANFTT